MQYLNVQLSIFLSECVDINFFSFFLFLHSLLTRPFSFVFLLPSVLLCHSSCPTFHFSLSFPCSYSPSFFLLPVVCISPPDAGPQLCGVPVLLPTWAERLFPPGPPPGANDWAVPGQRQPLPHIQPQQQVGRTWTAWNSDYESWWSLSTSWFQKIWAAVLTLLALVVAPTPFVSLSCSDLYLSILLWGNRVSDCQRDWFQGTFKNKFGTAE